MKEYVVPVFERKFLPRFAMLVGVVLLLCCGASWADILQVNAWAAFTASEPCISNCTETIGLSFQYDSSSFSSQPVSGTFSYGSSGFLGTFTGTGFLNLAQGYSPFYDTFGDELDLRFPGYIVNPADPLSIGVDTLGFAFYSCNSAPCVAAFGPNTQIYSIAPTIKSSLVTPIPTPEPSSLGLLLLTMLILGFIARAVRTPVSRSAIEGHRFISMPSNSQ